MYGRPSDKVSISKDILDYADKQNFDVKHFSMVHLALPEQTRAQRRVRIGAIQNAIIKPTNASIDEQYLAIQERIEEMVHVAGKMGVNVLGLQEAWTMPFAFCTREKQPWME